MSGDGYRDIKRISYSWTCQECEHREEVRSIELLERAMIAHQIEHHPENEAQYRRWALEGHWLDKDTVLGPSQQHEIQPGPSIITDPADEEHEP